MFRCIVQVDDFFTLADQPHQTFTGMQRHMADRFRIQALRGHQQITLVALVKQVNGADIDMHSFSNLIDHNVERFMQTGGRINFLHNAS